MTIEYFDVVLFSPPSRMINHYRPPVGLLYVGGFLTHKGLKVKIIDCPLKEQIRDRKFFENLEHIIEGVHQKMLDEFKQVKTKIVGLSCYTPEYFEVLRLAQEIKAIDPSVKIIAGGIHPTFYPQDFFDEKTGIDACVLGDGEVAMHELSCNILQDKADWGNVAGIAVFDPTTQKMALTQERALVENLDDISFPDYSLIDMDYYTNANPYAIRGCFLRPAYLLSTRGCPSQCTFCVAKKLRKYVGSGRMRSAESLIAELKILRSSYAIDAFYFIDDLFTIDKANVKRFCMLLKNERLGLLWGCSSKVSTLDEDLLKAMADAGCIQIDFGVERGSDEALRSVKKGFNISKVREIFKLCRRYRIRTFANMLINLPGETEKDLENILRLLDEISPEIVSLNIFTPYPGTEIYESADFSFSKKEYPLLSMSSLSLISQDPGRFKFCCHSVDLGEWVRNNSKHYNRTWPNLKFYLEPRYLRTLLRSKRKKNYVDQLGLLIREFINQKF